MRRPCVLQGLLLLVLCTCDGRFSWHVKGASLAAHAAWGKQQLAGLQRWVPTRAARSVLLPGGHTIPDSGQRANPSERGRDEGGLSGRGSGLGSVPGAPLLEADQDGEMGKRMTLGQKLRQDAKEAAVRAGFVRVCKKDKASALASTRLRAANASSGPGPEGMFPVPTIIGVCCQRSGTSSLNLYLKKLAAAQGRPPGGPRKELHFFDQILGDWHPHAPRRKPGSPIRLPNNPTPAWLYGAYAGQWMLLPQGRGSQGIAGASSGDAATSDNPSEDASGKEGVPTEPMAPNGGGAMADPSFCKAVLVPGASLDLGRAPLSVTGKVAHAVAQVPDPKGRSHAAPRISLYSPYITYEISPRYTSKYAAPWAMARVLPDPHAPVLVVMVRDPIKRAISSWFPKYRNPAQADTYLPLDLQWELDVVIPACFPRSYAAMVGGADPAAVTINPPGIVLNGTRARGIPDDKLGGTLLPDGSSCGASRGIAWLKQSEKKNCVQSIVKTHPPEYAKARGDNWFYTSWIARGLFGDQMRNLLCAGFLPSQIVVSTLTELSTEPGEVLRRIARAVDESGLVANKRVFDSSHLLEHEKHIVSGLKDNRPVIKLSPALVARLKSLFAADARDFLALVTQKNGFWVDERKLAAEFVDIFKP